MPAQDQQLVIREPPEIARAIDHAGIDPRNFRRAAQPVDPRIDVVFVFGNRVSVGRSENDVELIEAAEAREKGAERLDDATIARQQRQHIRIEGEAARAFDGDRQRGGDDDRDPQPLAVGP